MSNYDESYVLKTIEECDLSNRSNYKKLIKHLKENESLLNPDKTEINLDNEIAIKSAELNALKRNTQEDLKGSDSFDVFDQFIAKVQLQQKNRSNDENIWNNINEEMDKELKSLEMVQLFMKRNKTNEIKKIEVDESALIKANEILRHFCDQN